MLCLGGAIPFPSTSVNLNSGYRKPNRLTRASARRCECLDLHRELVPYGNAWSLQKDILKEKKAFLERNQDCSDKLIVLQHHPVYTLGTGSSEKFLNFDRNDPPFEVHRTERGGEVTYHGPGQLVMYPILDLRNHRMDLHWYLRSLEEVLIRAISSAFSIKVSRIEGLTGVWVGELFPVLFISFPPFHEIRGKTVTEFAAGDQKLAAIGIRVSQWITYHGLALNVTTDLTPFKWIVPCGLRNHRVGSVKQLLAEIEKDAPLVGDQRLIDLSYKALIREFSEVFQLEIHQKTVSMSQLPSRN